VSVASISDAKRARERREAWEYGLAETKEGARKRCVANVLHVLSLHPDWDGVLGYDAFAECVITTKTPPMRNQDRPTGYAPGEWSEQDSTRTAAWFQTEVSFEPTSGMVESGVAAIAQRNVVHPVRDWLASLNWDGKVRLPTMLHVYFGAEPSAYSEAVGSRWMISAVARVRRPGCKADSMLVLESPEQGIGKSSALRALAGDAWFADTGVTVGDKDSYQVLRRKWIYEFAELSAIKGRDVERVKNFVSSQVDTYRPSYGRRAVDFPRQCVFAGSTNQDHYLHDPTGSRRFWPVACHKIDLDALRRDREQLWAEAVVRFEGGEPWFLDSLELRSVAAVQAEQREERDDWLDLVARWLKAPTVPVVGARDERQLVLVETMGVSTAEVLLGGLSFAPEKINQAATTRVGQVLRKLGYEPRQLREAGQRVRRYFPSQRGAEGCDEGCDTGTASNPPLSHVTAVTPPYAHTYEGEGARREVPRKPAVPAVTCDTSEGA